MGWALILIFAASSLVALWRFGNMGRQGLELGGASMLIALAGYAWWGNPGLKGVSTTASEAAGMETSAQDAKLVPDGQFSAEGNAMMLADAMMRAGKTRQAITQLNAALKANPQSADLWVNLGNALVVHGGGLMNPAAQVAFQRAADIAPEHPGPPFFTGLALAQSGKLEEAAELWKQLLDRAPKDAPWRADLETRLAQISQMSGPAPESETK